MPESSRFFGIVIRMGVSPEAKRNCPRFSLSLLQLHLLQVPSHQRLVSVKQSRP